MAEQIQQVKVNVSDEDIAVCANCGADHFFQAGSYVKFQPPIVGQGPGLALIQPKMILICIGCGHQLPLEVAQVKTKKEIQKVVEFPAGN